MQSKVNKKGFLTEGSYS